MSEGMSSKLILVEQGDIWSEYGTLGFNCPFCTDRVYIYAPTANHETECRTCDIVFDVSIDIR